MLVPGMLSLEDAMEQSAYSKEELFDWGISGQLQFLVVVPEVGACRVPDMALSHFMAGSETFEADQMAEHWSGRLSGKWTIARDRLRIYEQDWHKLTQLAQSLADAANGSPEPAQVQNSDSVLVTIKTAGHTSTFWENAQQRANRLESDRVRHAAGHYTMGEAAESIASQQGLDAERVQRDMVAAFFEGNLSVYNPSSGLKVGGRRCYPVSDWVTLKGVNAWLCGVDALYRWDDPRRASESECESSRAQGAVAANKSDPTGLDDWKADAAKRGWEIVAEATKGSRTPSQLHIANQIAREWNEAKRFGPKGSALSGEYIKRHALVPSGVSCKRARLAASTTLKGNRGSQGNQGKT